jgi:hypothetical protein
MPFNVQLFDFAKGLDIDPEISKAFSQKLKEITNMYEIKFRTLAVKAENLEDHVKLLN